MNKEEIVSFLEKHHTKNDMYYLTDQVRQKVISIQDVLELSFDDRKKVGFRAAWFLETVVSDCLGRFKPVAKEFLNTYHLQKNWSARRSFSKIALYMLDRFWFDIYDLKKADFQNCLETSFDWLLENNSPLAVQCNCIDIIYKLSDDEDWVLEELMPILERNLLTTSPALLSRTKAILEKYQKRKPNVPK